MEIKNEHYSGDKIRGMKCTWNMIIGQRSNGKTFDFLYHGISEFWKSGCLNQFAIVRRLDEVFKRDRARQVFAGLEKDDNGENRIEEITGGQYNGIHYLSRQWFLCRYENGERIETMSRPFAFGFALSQMENDKGGNYPDISMIIFDEFLTRVRYLDNETALFFNVVSTIARNKGVGEIVIYMLGNTVSMYCPYFDEFGIDIKELKQGEIRLVEWGDKGAKLAVEYCSPIAKSKFNKTSIFAFRDSPRLNMITEGAWETEIYPHKPTPIRENEIKFIYFIVFGSEMFQCEIIHHEKSVYTFIHKKTSPIKNPDKDLIYCPKYDPRPNWRRKITRPKYDFEKFIVSQFAEDKIFYDTNHTGEAILNYLKFCEMGVK